MPPAVPICRNGCQREKEPLSAPVSLGLQIGFHLPTIPTLDCSTLWLWRVAAFISRNRRRSLQARPTTALGLSFPPVNTHRKFYWHSKRRMAERLGDILKRVAATHGVARSQPRVDSCVLQIMPNPGKQ